MASIIEDKDDKIEPPAEEDEELTMAAATLHAYSARTLGVRGAAEDDEVATSAVSLPPPADPLPSPPTPQ